MGTPRQRRANARRRARKRFMRRQPQVLLKPAQMRLVPYSPRPIVRISWTQRIRERVLMLYRKLFPLPLTPQQKEFQQLLEYSKVMKREQEFKISRKNYPHTDFFGGVQGELSRLSHNRISVYRFFDDDEDQIRIRCS